MQEAKGRKQECRMQDRESILFTAAKFFKNCFKKGDRIVANYDWDRYPDEITKDHAVENWSDEVGK